MQAPSNPVPTIIRRIEPRDLAAVQRCSAEIYRANNISYDPRYFEWAFLRAGGDDHTGDHGAILAEANGEVVGFFSSADALFTINGEVRPGVWGHEWFTKPKFGPIGLKMLFMKLRGVTVYGGGGFGLEAQSVLRSVWRAGVWFYLERTIGILDPASALDLSLAKGPETLPYLKTVRLNSSAAGVSLSFIERFTETYETVWDAIRGSFTLATHRSARYMNWRYAEHPYFSYRLAECDSEAGLAYFVWREEKIAGGLGIVCRLCEAIGHPEAIWRGFPLVAQAMRDAGASLVDFFCSSGEVNAALVAAGMVSAITRTDLDMARLFQPVEASVTKSLDFALFFPDTPGTLPPFDVSRCYITRGDANQDRPHHA